MGDAGDLDLELLGATERAALTAIAKPVSYPEGETIYHEGDDAASLLLIQSGAARVVRYAADGKEATLAFLGPEDVAGELGCLSGLKRTATVEAISPVSALVVSRSDLLALLRRDGDLALAFIRMLSARLAGANTLVTSLNTQRMRGRLASGLLQIARRHSEQERTGLRLSLSLTQRELGAYVGLSRENVSRVLNEWRVDKVVAMNAQAGEIVLLDMAQLEEIAEGAD
jgi:CRP-like cAMP-binding protein